MKEDVDVDIEEVVGVGVDDVVGTGVDEDVVDVDVALVLDDKDDEDDDPPPPSLPQFPKPRRQPVPQCSVEEPHQYHSLWFISFCFLFDAALGCRPRNSGKERVGRARSIPAAVSESASRASRRVSA